VPSYSFARTPTPSTGNGSTRPAWRSP
jgi:hypothetical protein